MLAELSLIALVIGGVAIGHLREQSTASPPRATDFSWALIEGPSGHVLYLEGGTTSGQPTAVQVRDVDGAVVVGGATAAYDPDINPGTCNGTRPGWPMWWRRTVPAPVAEAVRRGDDQTYVIEALVDGTWRTMLLTPMTCPHS